jgi:3D (Asp-Asp-Asp) domain-containing protein
MLSKNLKKYLKRAGIVAVSAALGTATFITISSDKATVYSDSRMISVAQASSSVQETVVEYSRIDYTDLQSSIAEAELLAKVERSEREANQTALVGDSYAVEYDTEDYESTTESTEQADDVLYAEESAESTTAVAGASKEENSGSSSSDLTVSDITTEGATGDDLESGDDLDVLYVASDSYAPGTYLGSYVTTAYCSCAKCCGKTNGITASGTRATSGRTVAAPSSIPFGTELVINGHTYVVEDRGGAINGNRIDIYFDSHQAAINYGRKTVDVYVK